MGCGWAIIVLIVVFQRFLDNNKSSAHRKTLHDIPCESVTIGIFRKTKLIPLSALPCLLASNPRHLSNVAYQASNDFNTCSIKKPVQSVL
jgi:hypothetical protein